MKYSTDELAEKIADIENTIINEWLFFSCSKQKEYVLNIDKLKIEYYKLQDAITSKQKRSKND